MTDVGLARKILATGRVAETAVPPDEAVPTAVGLGGSVSAGIKLNHVEPVRQFGA